MYFHTIFYFTSLATPETTVTWQHQIVSKNCTGIIQALAANKLSEFIADELKAQKMIGNAVHAHATYCGLDITEYTRVKHLILHYILPQSLTHSITMTSSQFFNWMAFVKMLKQPSYFFQQVCINDYHPVKRKGKDPCL